jgi:type IV pilus biogenesis protein CpaD/CtpE
MKKLILLVVAASITMLAIGCAKPDEGTTGTTPPADSTPKADAE